MTRTLVLHTLPADPTLIDTDLSLPAAGVAAALEDVVVEGVRGEPGELLALLHRHRPDVVFNLCEAPCGVPTWEPHVPALLAWLGQRHTGAGSEALALCHRKDRVRALLRAASVPIPGSGGLPAFVKPVAEHGSAGIEAGCLCRDATEVEAQRARLGEVVVEDYLPGRELVVALWGREAEHAAVGEVRFPAHRPFLTWEAKWLPISDDYRGTTTTYPADVSPALAAELLQAARGAWAAIGLWGYARMDLRLDAEGRPRVIDVNPNPDLTPDDGLTSTSGMARAVLSAGWSWADFIRFQVEIAR